MNSRDGIASRRAREILTTMRDTGAELVYADRVCWIDNKRVAGRSMLYNLLRLMALHTCEPYSARAGYLERYTISETGRALLQLEPAAAKGRKRK